MSLKQVMISSHSLKWMLENPNKNFLMVFGTHRALLEQFERLAQDVVTHLSPLPIMINKQERCFTFPEGGRLMLKVIAMHNDVEKIMGHEIKEASFDESWRDNVRGAERRSFIIDWVTSRKRQK